jgi:hypothetical protein
VGGVNEKIFLGKRDELFAFRMTSISLSGFAGEVRKGLDFG